VRETGGQLPEDFRALQDALVNTESIEQFLHDMAVLAARLIGGDLSCGMTMRSNGRPVTVACSDPVAAAVDAVQYELDNGPCLHAMRDGRVVRIEDTTDKARWPEFERRAAAHGIRSCLALPLSSEGRRVGALNLYARDASAFGTAEAQRAADFAGNASGALTLAIRLASHAALIEQLRSSLASRTVIDQALGIIMAREQCTQARAFAILRSASQNSNVKLRDIASAIVTSVSGEPPQPPPAFEGNLSKGRGDYPTRRLRRRYPLSRRHSLATHPGQAGPRGPRSRLDKGPAGDRCQSGPAPAARPGR
jgi:transcriptional regulator with GAF, ATPase, and Fis domain